MENKKRDEGVTESRDDGEPDVEWCEEEEKEEEDRLELALIGRIWTERNININAFITTMKNVWQTSNGLDISNIGKNKFVF